MAKVRSQYVCSRKEVILAKVQAKMNGTFDIFTVMAENFPWLFYGFRRVARRKGITRRLKFWLPAGPQCTDSRLKTHLTWELQDSRLTSQYRPKTQDSRLTPGGNC